MKGCGTAFMSDLDDFDLKILRRLQRDARLTSDAIGSDVGLSPSAVQRRIKRLRSIGAVSKEIAVLDPAMVGRPLTIIVQVSVERRRPDVVESFMKDVRAVPEIQQCYYVTGEYDFILIFSCKDMSEYERLVRRLFFANEDVHRFQTNVTISSVKVGLEVPI
jgi:Lrp/AsnC family leucine-responsive transcriptional regulator